MIRGYGWSDFLGSLPFPGLRLLRLFHVAYVIRLLGKDGLSKVRRDVLEKRGNSALILVFFLILLSLEWASLSILAVESKAAGANIRTASDALWWAYVSITTVGYGDRYPVTNAGRMIGIVLLAVGVGLFGVLTGYLAEVFLVPHRARRTSEPAAKPDNAHSRLAEINALLQEQLKANSALQEKVRQLEDLLREN
jgi:voltage-gated potassium channel